MLRVGLRLLLVSIPLFFVGFASLKWAIFEVARLVGVACAVGGMALLLIWYARAPAPTKD
jgi:hypothetical protein